MRTMIALMALLVAFHGPRPGFGQGIYGLTPPRPGDLPVAPSRANAPDKRSRSLSYYYSDSTNVRSSLIRPSWSFPVSRVTLLYISPPSVATPQPVVIIPAARQNRDEDRAGERIPPPRLPEAERPVVPEEVAPGTPASVFRPIRPEDRAWARVPAIPEPAGPVEPAKPSMPVPKRGLPPVREPPPLPGPPAAAAEPKTASAQLVQSGKEAGKARRYSRAERSFRRATEELPEDPRAHFLLAQARFALRKYAEAVAAIHAGMRLQPDWPNVRYRPRDLYGLDPDDFSGQLKRLADAFAKNADDPFLAFLYAYELWFDNRKDEARLILRRAKALAPDPSFSERFLQSKADSPVNDAVVELLPPGPRF
jgi:hypothetical protein